MNKSNEWDISVPELFRILLQWKTLAIAAVLIAFAVTAPVRPPVRYTATSSVYIEYYTGGQLSPSYAEILAQDYAKRIIAAPARQQAADKLGVDLSALQDASVQAVATAGSRYIDITVNSGDRELAARYADTLAEVLTDSSYTKTVDGSSSVTRGTSSSDSKSDSSNTSTTDTSGRTESASKDTSHTDGTSAKTETWFGAKETQETIANDTTSSGSSSDTNTSTAVGTGTSVTTNTSTGENVTKGDSVVTSSLTFSIVAPAVAVQVPASARKGILSAMFAALSCIIVLRILWWLFSPRILSVKRTAALDQTPVLGDVGGASDDAVLRRLGLGKPYHKKDELRRLYYTLHCHAKDSRIIALLPCGALKDAKRLAEQLAGQIVREGGTALVLDASDSAQPTLSEEELLALPQKASDNGFVTQRLGGELGMLQTDSALTRALPVLKDRYACILLLTPDYTLSVDSVLLGAACEGTVVAVKQNQTKTAVYLNCMNALRLGGVSALGTVLTNYPVRR